MKWGHPGTGGSFFWGVWGWWADWRSWCWGIGGGGLLCAGFLPSWWNKPMGSWWINETENGKNGLSHFEIKRMKPKTYKNRRKVKMGEWGFGYL